MKVPEEKTGRSSFDGMGKDLPSITQQKSEQKMDTFKCIKIKFKCTTEMEIEKTPQSRENIYSIHDR